MCALTMVSHLFGGEIGLMIDGYAGSCDSTGCVAIADRYARVADVGDGTPVVANYCASKGCSREVCLNG